MSSAQPYVARVMVSSTVLDLGGEREVARATIAEEGLVPWLLERPPREFEHMSGYELSVQMAQRCDLYLLILGGRYGSRPEGMPPGDTRSVTHLEYDVAREDNSRKLRVFVASDADEI